jgi:2-oxoglutarate dehydrogenase E1 component
VRKNARGASWERDNWPITPNGELVSALDGNWAESRGACGRQAEGRRLPSPGCRSPDGDILQAQRDSVRAIMMIRAYRMRGHLHADLDPLGISEPEGRYRA